MLDLGLRRPFPPGFLLELGSGWGRPRSSTLHYGADFFTPTGTPVLAAAAGKVIKAQRTLTGNMAGIWVGLEHPLGFVTRYMHLSSVAPGLEVGQQVRAGQEIGRAGSSGFDASNGPHLHFDIKVPARMLPAVEAAVGKPTSGWGPLQEPWGYAIPVEPWIPVDRYTKRTADDAKAYGIPLYRKPGPWLTLLAIAAATWAIIRRR